MKKKIFRTHFTTNNTNLDQSSLRKWVFIEETLEEAHSSGHAEQPGLRKARIREIVFSGGGGSRTEISSGSWPPPFLVVSFFFSFLYVGFALLNSQSS